MFGETRKQPTDLPTCSFGLAWSMMGSCCSGMALFLAPGNIEGPISSPRLIRRWLRSHGG